MTTGIYIARTGWILLVCPGIDPSLHSYTSTVAPPTSSPCPQIVRTPLPPPAPPCTPSRRDSYQDPRRPTPSLPWTPQIPLTRLTMSITDHRTSPTASTTRIALKTRTPLVPPPTADPVRTPSPTGHYYVLPIVSPLQLPPSCPSATGTDLAAAAPVF